MPGSKQTSDVVAMAVVWPLAALSPHVGGQRPPLPRRETWFDFASGFRGDRVVELVLEWMDGVGDVRGGDP